jgi:putative spermidine/putrescine transport system permease protein
MSAPDNWYLRTPLRRLATLLYQRSRLLLAVLLGPPMIWFCVIYLGSLLAMLWQGFYSFDDFSMSVLPKLTLANYANIFAHGNFDIVLRTLIMACSVTLAAAAIAFPIAYYMSRYATPGVKAFFYIGVMLPMWASYIVKAYSWTVILAKGGIVFWVFGQLHVTWLLEALLRLPYIGGSTL